MNSSLLPSSEEPPIRISRGERRRQALMDAARQIFLQRGYEATSMDEVTRIVGGSKASLYQYFGSKRNLFVEILSAQTEEFMKDLGIPDDADTNVADTLTAIGKRYLGMILDKDRQGMFRLLYAESEQFPELAQQFFEWSVQRSCQELGRYLQRQCDAGQLDCVDSETAASQYFALVRGQPYVRGMLRLPPFQSGDDLDRHVASAVHLFLHGYSCHDASH